MFVEFFWGGDVVAEERFVLRGRRGWNRRCHRSAAHDDAFAFVQPHSTALSFSLSALQWILQLLKRRWTFYVQNLPLWTSLEEDMELYDP